MENLENISEAGSVKEINSNWRVCPLTEYGCEDVKNKSIFEQYCSKDYTQCFKYSLNAE